MATKIKFSDILHQYRDPIVEKTSADNPVNKVHGIHKPLPQNMSILEKLQFFVDSSNTCTTQFDSKSQPNILSELPTFYAIDHQIEIDQDINNTVTIHNQGEVADEIIMEENNDLRSNDSLNYNWFFSSNVLEDPESIIHQTHSKSIDLIRDIQCDSVENYQMFGNFHPNVKIPLKPIQFIQNIPGIHKMFKSKSSQGSLKPSNKTYDGLCSILLQHLVTYADVFMDGRNHLNDEQFTKTILMHVCSHLIKARHNVTRHNQKLKKLARENAFISHSKVSNGKKVEVENLPEDDTLVGEKDDEEIDIKDEDNVDDDVDSGEDPHVTSPVKDNDRLYHDQGYCRPRVLILCALRHQAKQMIDMIIEQLGDNTSLANYEKLENEFGYLPPDDDMDIYQKKKKPSPDDWNHLFKDKNIDDDFKIGIQINPGQGKGSGSNKGAYIRLFSDFYISDLIIASPIGLRYSIEHDHQHQQQQQSSSTDNKLNKDFLSSLEMILIPHADVLLMQNWDHVQFILQQSNQLPTEHHPETDFSRIRSYFLEQQSSYHRQLIMSSHFNDPELHAFFRLYGKSVAGMLKLKKDWKEGDVTQVVVDIKQIFQRIPKVTSWMTHDEDKFQYFREKILLQILRLKQSRTMIITPSYLHYVRIRNELIHQEANAVYICEYSRDSEISRGRSRFFHGLKDILLYSGRAHFFRRYNIRGAQHLIFYSLPQYAHFYSEIVNMVGDVNESDEVKWSDSEKNVSCIVLYTAYERMALERIVGKKRCEHLIHSAKTTFMFC